MALVYRKTLTVSAASTNGVATTQTPSGAGDLTLVSATVTLANTGQRPEIVTLADLSNRTFTFYGTEVGTGRSMVYSMAGPNATTGIAGISFATITRVAISGAAAGALTVGWAAQADTQPFPLDLIYAPTDVSFAGIIVSGSPTFTVRFTMDDVQDQTADPGSRVWFNHPSVTAQTSNATGNFGKPVTACSLYVSAASVMNFIILQGQGKN